MHPLRMVLGELGAERRGQAACASSRCRAGRRRACRPARCRRAGAPPGDGGKSVLRDRGAGGGPGARRRRACATRCSHAPRGCRARRGRCSMRWRSSLTRPELWLLEALAGATVDRLEECLASGMLVSAGTAVAFRHELARLTIEESLAPDRRVGLHRAALAALAAPPDGVVDLDQLAHHAEAAGRCRSRPAVRAGGGETRGRRSAHIARRPPSTGARCASPAASRWPSGRCCSTAARQSARSSAR